MGYKYKQGEDYESRNQDMIDELTKQYTERQFSYDSNTDKAYQDYARMMRESGQKAMEDTMGKASALTGGYGNSYAQTAGQQVYNDYVSQAAVAANDYYDRALARFNSEGDDILNKLNIVQNQESTDRATWESDYAKALSDAQNKAAYGDYSGFSAILGVSEDEIEASSRQALGTEQIEAFKNALKLGNGNDYFDYLVGAGYNTDNLPTMADSWVKSGELDIEISKDDDGNVIYTTNDPFVINQAASDDVNRSIAGVNKLRKGENFTVARTKKDNGSSDNWDVQLGDEVTDNEVLLSKAKDNSTKTGIYLYNNALYYMAEGRVFKVEPQNMRKDEYNDLLEYLKGN